MTDHTAPELKPCPFCGGEDVQDWGEGTWSRPVKWMYCTECQSQGPRVMAGREEDESAWLHRVRCGWNDRADLHRAEVDALVAAAQCLRDAQRAYMANRGNNDLGRQVGIRAEELDAALAAFTPTDSRAEVDALVAAAYEDAAREAFNCWDHGIPPSVYQHHIRALTPADARAALRAHTEAAVRRALEAAARIECDADFVAVWGPYEHGVNDMQTAIRALADNPAQFIGGLNVYAR